MSFYVRRNTRNDRHACHPPFALSRIYQGCLAPKLLNPKRGALVTNSIHFCKSLLRLALFAHANLFGEGWQSLGQHPCASPAEFQAFGVCEIPFFFGIDISYLARVAFSFGHHRTHFRRWLSRVLMRVKSMGNT
jgi:hypothetical protein